MIQDAVVRNLEIIGEAAKAVSPRLRQELPGVPWREMARFRDLAIHHYGQIPSEEVWEIVVRDLPAIRREIAKRPASIDRSRSR